MNHDSSAETSTCWKCGYYVRQFISRCPVCYQAELQEKQNALFERQARNAGYASGGSGAGSGISSGFGYLILIVIALGIVGWIIELIASFFHWVSGVMSTTWTLATAPVRFTYGFFVTDWAWWKLGVVVLVMWLLIAMLSSSDVAAKSSPKPRARKAKATAKPKAQVSPKKVAKTANRRIVRKSSEKTD